MGEEAGAWEIVVQMMQVIPRSIMITLIIIFIITPVGCYVNRRDETTDLELFNAMYRAEFCVKEEGFDKAKMEGCFKQEKYGLKLTTKGEKPIILNEPIYKNYNPAQYVRDEKTVNGVNIDLVFIPK